MKEEDIVHENGPFWVLRQKDRYTVFRSGITHSTSDSSYARDEDGLSIAKARCDYLARRAEFIASLPPERECCGTFVGSHHRATCSKYRGKFKEH